MKSKTKKNSKNIKILYKNAGKFKNFYSTLIGNKVNYKPELSINRTINQYINAKLSGQKINTENSSSSNQNTVKSVKNKKYLVSNKSDLKVKPFYHKNGNNSEYNQMKNGGNYEDLNNNKSISVNKFFNISKIEIPNDRLAKSSRSSKENNLSINKSINDILNYNKINSINNGINKKLIINGSKRHLVSKINPKVNNDVLRNKNIFNNDYYNYENNCNYKSYNNIFDRNEIYSAIKNLKSKFKNISKDSYINHNKQISQDKIINSSLYEKVLEKKKTCETAHKKQNIKTCKNNIYSFKNKDGKNKKIIIKKTKLNEIENGSNLKDGKTIIKNIIKDIFKNAGEIEKKLYRKNESKNKLCSPLLSKYKKGNVIINNNTSILKYNYFNKEKYFFEYHNQMTYK